MYLLSEHPTYLPNSAVHTFKSRMQIPADRHILWRIESGVVRTCTWDEDGNPNTLGFWGAGDVVGQARSTVRPYRIECMSDVKAQAIPSHSQFRDAGLLSQMQQTENFLKIMHCKSLERRLLEFLTWLASKFGCEVDRGTLIQVHLTHQIVAEAIGSTRVSVTRLMGKLEREGVIAKNRRRFILLPNRSI